MAAKFAANKWNFAVAPLCPLSSVLRMGRVSEGDDVLARWSDGLLYLGNVKRVSACQRGCVLGIKRCVPAQIVLVQVWKNPQFNCTGVFFFLVTFCLS